MQHLIKLASRCPVRSRATDAGKCDATCARAVAAFAGDINADAACRRWHSETLLGFVAARDAPLTLRALAARGDVDVYKVDSWGDRPVYNAVRHNRAAAFLAAFPAYDVNAVCTRDGRSPLDVAGGYDFHVTPECLEALLDAGAKCDDGPNRPWRVRWLEDPLLAAVVKPHLAWSKASQRLRRAWMVACAACATNSAAIAATAPSPLLVCMLADALRVCIAPDTGTRSHAMLSEYAVIIATFL